MNPTNACLDRIVRAVASNIFSNQVHNDGGPPIYFRGTVLVVKREKNSRAREFADIGPKDMLDVAKPLFRVNSNHAGG